MKYAPYLCPNCYSRLIDTATDADPSDGAIVTPLLECDDGCGVSDRALKPYRTRMNSKIRNAARKAVRPVS